MNKEACHLTVLWVLFWIGVPTLDGRALTRLTGAMDQLTRNGHRIIQGAGAGPQSENPTPWEEEETDHLLGAPRKGASDRETWGLRTRVVL